MRLNKNLIFYLLMIIVFGGLMYWITQQGELLEPGKVQVEPVKPALDQSPFALFQESFSHNLTHPLALLILQIISIILVSRFFGFIFNKIGQPTVIGEIVAGIVLGPSLMGLFFPEVSEFLFAKASLPNLQFLSQVGLILFMFVIGMELDLKVLRNQAHDAVVISHASIVIPYFLGMSLAYFLYQNYAPGNISFLSFALFMGIAMSITAFPVLARVIQERDLSKTKLGSIAITCAAADDITAWCLLATVIAIVKAGTFVSAIFTIVLALGYVLLMVVVVQPVLKRIGNVYSDRETISKPIVAIAFLVLLASAYVAEIIGIHALFGAFLAGVIMPPNFNFRKIMTEKIEDVSLVLLLPLFFVFTGLRTQIGLLNETHLWMVCGWIILTAVAGKFGGSAIAARFVGQSWKDSLSLGALMNTRGLMELIVLNIGYDLGVLTPEVFAMMVLMALITTFMTGPALDLINYFYPDKKSSVSVVDKFYKILISFGPAIKGKKLLRLADQLTHKKTTEANITALHLTPSADINQKEAREYEKESFRLVKHEAENLGISIKTIYKATNDINKEITGEANKGKYDLLLVGGSQSVFSADVVGGKVKNYLEDTTCQVGVLVDKDFEVADRIVLMLQDFSDLFLISFAERFIQNNNAKIVLSDPNRLVKMNTIFRMAVEKVNNENPESIEVYESHDHTEEFFNRFNLMLISYSSWKHLNRRKNPWLAYSPTILILKPEGRLH
ncbi:cation:proton antiporter domain-containing protein [Chryseosolibacter indicus]|uniref:Cation:proton antiporter n=1 Tax=Chryseosolibacter indicus TaxID=2782351 RepID=A0ABS5VX05_9BACT|nr:cation:proton antiporter [Chryseosolibacter indicus]MBT1705861.1 cation:proton antiporter [Chryseosolibacter indicus]